MICECGHTIFVHRAETWWQGIWRMLTLRFRACDECSCPVFIEEDDPWHQF